MHEKSLYYAGWLLVAVIMVSVSGCLYLYINQCPTDQILSDVDNIVQSLDSIHESLDNIAQAIGIDNGTRKELFSIIELFKLFIHYQFSI